MKKILLCTIVAAHFVGFSQNVYWNFETASASNPVSGLTVSEISHGNNTGNTDLLSNTSPSSGYENASGNNNAAARARVGSFSTESSGSTYFQFTLTPQPGSIVKINSISFGSRSTTTGPVAYRIRADADSYSSDVAAGSLLNNAVWALVTNSSLAITTSTGTAITLRIYGYNGTGSNPVAPNWRIDDLTIHVALVTAGALPVRFDALKATEIFGGVNIQWRNLSETDVHEYTLERSADGGTFVPIQKLLPAKNDGGKSDYQLRDVHPFAGNSFYRIKAEEVNGKTFYSDIVRFQLRASSIFLNLYPNPTKGNQIGLQITNLPAGSYHISIRSLSAQAIMSQSLMHSGGSLTQTISLNHLKPGIYILEINGSVKLQRQFIVQ